jgi:very-short-patch-repair endonuclease
MAIPGGVLSHRDAAGLHGIRPANHTKVDVTTTTRAADHPGIKVHRTRVLDAQDVITLAGIRATTLARTLVDLAGTVPRDHLASALRSAEDRRALDVAAVRASMARTKGRRGPGHRALRETLAELEALATTLTRSSLEDAFLRLIDRSGLKRPATNVDVNGHEVDAFWSEARLVVELDGWAFHNSYEAFQRDRARTAELMRAGYQVVRFTHYDVVHRPTWVAETLASLTAARATMSSPWP